MIKHAPFYFWQPVSLNLQAVTPKTLNRLVMLSILTVFTSSHQAAAQGTAFTYQGQLSAYGTSANGNYDFTFALYNDPQNGSQVGLAETNSAVSVTSGLFTTTLDFGSVPWNGGSLWLQILVRTNGPGTFSSLTPRQQLTSTPYAIQSLKAATATTANSANSVAAANIIGTIPNSSLPSNPFFSGNIAANSFSGNGSGLTNLNSTAFTGTGSLTNNSEFEIACYGDSLTGGLSCGIQTWPGLLTRVSGRNALNLGLGGQTSGQITARMLADTNNSGTYIIWEGYGNLGAVATNPPATANPWCTNQPFNDIAYQVNWCVTNGNKRFLVLSLPNTWAFGIGTGVYTFITNFNAQLAAAYGTNYFDIRNYLVQLADVSLYPTDSTNLALDCPAYHLCCPLNPPHFNDDGLSAIAGILNSILSIGFPNQIVVSATQVASLLGSAGSFEVADARLSTNVPLLNAANEFTGPFLGPQLFQGGPVTVEFDTPGLAGTPTQLLIEGYVNQNQYAWFGLDPVNSFAVIESVWNGVQWNPVVFSQHGGGVSVGTTSHNPNFTLDVNGSASFSNGVTAAGPGFTGNGSHLTNLNPGNIIGGLTTNILLGTNIFCYTNGLLMQIR